MAARSARLVGLAGLVLAVGLGTAGCGLGLADRRGEAGAGVEADSAMVDVSAAMGAEGQALAALGFSADDIVPTELMAGVVPDSSASPSLDAVPEASTDAAPEAAPSASPGARQGERLHQWRKARVLLRKNTLHGEVVVQSEEGTKTVVVQRGEVTAVDGDSITVKSADGFSLTWAYSDDLHVVEHRASVQADAIEVGDRVGLAGAKDGDASVARLIVIPREK
jgi:hypothetical protein